MFKEEREIQEAVENFMTEKLNSEGWAPFDFDNEVVDHIKNMCVSILCTKYKVGFPGGSFVQAVVDNNLVEAFGRADHINQRHMKVYAELLYKY